MSDVQETTAPLAAQPPAITIPTGATEVPTSAAASTEEPKDAAAAEKKDDEAAEKAVEPITEGLLSYKGPGLLKSLIPSKRDFWLSDSVDPELDLSSYMRGEKPDVSHPVAAWASQTSKGLLFFNKKGDTNHHKPGSVLPLYDATDLRKQSPHEISFRIAGHDHTLKAATDAERDGWYISLEKAIELSKASKESIQGSEGYKAKIDELSKPVAPVVPVAAAAAATKSSEGDKVDEAARPTSEGSEGKKNQKSRSTSRGVFDRLRGKKEEQEQKKEEDKEESKKTDEGAEVAAVVAGTAAVAGGAAIAAEEDKKASEEPAPAEEKTEEKPKAAKRASIFGSLFKSQPKEKDQKEAEPTEEVKDGVVVAENPPQLPEATTAGEVVEPAAPVEPAVAAEEAKAETEAKAEEPKTETAAASKEKKNFLSGFSFKRGRSVSPSAPKDVPAKAETTEESAEASKTEEPVAVAPAPVEAAEKPEEANEEAAKAEPTPTANKRQSIISSFGRRASHMLKGRQAPKDTAAAPAAEESKTEAAESAPVEEPAAAGETVVAASTEEEPKPHIGDVVPEAVNVGQPQPANPAVTASA